MIARIRNSLIKTKDLRDAGRYIKACVDAENEVDAQKHLDWVLRKLGAKLSEFGTYLDKPASDLEIEARIGTDKEKALAFLALCLVAPELAAHPLQGVEPTMPITVRLTQSYVARLHDKALELNMSQPLLFKRAMEYWLANGAP